MVPLISGDNTRRNVPRQSSRRAKVKVVKQGKKADLVQAAADGSEHIDDDRGTLGSNKSRFQATAGTGDDNEIEQGRRGTLDGGTSSRVDLRRHKDRKSLSRVAQEGSSGRENSALPGKSGSGGRDLETGSGGTFHESVDLGKDVEDKKISEAGDGSRSTYVPLTPNREGRKDGGAEGEDRDPHPSSDESEERNAFGRNKEAVRIKGRLGDAGGSSAATLGDDSARVVVEETDGLSVSHSGDGGVEGPKSGFAWTPSLHDVIGPVRNDSDEAAHIVLEGTSSGDDSEGAATTGILPINVIQGVSTV